MRSSWKGTCLVSIEGRRGIQVCDRQERLGFHSATCHAQKRLIQPALDCATAYMQVLRFVCLERVSFSMMD
jgi:hypothetical protein